MSAASPCRGPPSRALTNSLLHGRSAWGCRWVDSAPPRNLRTWRASWFRTPHATSAAPQSIWCKIPSCVRRARPYLFSQGGNHEFRVFGQSGARDRRRVRDRLWGGCRPARRPCSLLEFEIPLAPPGQSSVFGNLCFSCAKNAHLVEIRHPGSTGELLTSWFNASFADFCQFALRAVDVACRWTWRLTSNKRRVLPGSLSIGACSGRRHQFEGALLRRPIHRKVKTAGP